MSGFPRSGSGAVSSVFTRTGAVVAAGGDYTAAQVTNAADKSSGSTQTFTAEVAAPSLGAAGITGTVAGRFCGVVGGTTGPASGTFLAGDFVIDGYGTTWICTTPGTIGGACVFTKLAAGGAVATAREVAVGTGTTIVTYTPAASGNFLVAIYFRVITATTNVTVTVTWTDATGAQTLTLLNVVAETTGSYTFTSFMVDDLATDAITVTMTAGTASQVYASASILQG
jgi:hypothetical protein